MRVIVGLAVVCALSACGIDAAELAPSAASSSAEGGAAPASGSRSSSGGASSSTASVSSTGGGSAASTGGSASTTGGASDGGGGAQTTSTGGGGGGITAQTCPTGDFMTGIGPGGVVTCGPVDLLALDAVNQGCSIYFGESDGCNGCTSTPDKWGFVSANHCANGNGVRNGSSDNDTCNTMNLGGTNVVMFGLNPEGDVDGDDKLFSSLHCITGTSATATGPCNAGQFVTAIDNGVVTCTDSNATILAYVGQSCSLYTGIIDQCDGCTTAPPRWGFSNDGACTVGDNASPATDTCQTTTLEGERVKLFGLNPNNDDVNDDDKMYVGLHCVDPPAVGDTHPSGPCPAGQFALGVDADGHPQCSSLAPLVEAMFRAHCAVYFGWQDSCSGCMGPPTKWGGATDGPCISGEGTNSGCATATLGGVSLELYGLNFDGDVNTDDKLHFGFLCK